MQNEPIETITSPAHYENEVFVEEQTLKIYMDTDPQNPRTEYDNFGHMVCFHGRYSLGDEGHGIRQSVDFGSWKELKNYLIKKRGAVVILPMYMYDHSGITVRTHPFNDGWDSGQIGFTYATRKEILENFPITKPKKLTPDLIQKATALLISEVQTYDDYLTGNVYGYVLEDVNGDELCSCWGYSGDRATEYIKAELHMNLIQTTAQSTTQVEATPVIN